MQLFNLSAVFVALQSVLVQIPTDYPPVRSKEIPDNTTWLIIVGGIVFFLLLVIYLLRLDRKLKKWFEK